MSKMLSIIRSNTLRPNCMRCVKSSQFKSSCSPLIRSQTLKHLSTHEEYKKKFDFELPPLMRFSPKPMPNIFYSLKNQFIIHFFLKPLIDQQFNTRDFLSGAKQALSVISANLANDHIEGIKDMLTTEAYEEVSENFKKFNEKQKQLLKVNVEDILFCFPYNIDVERLAPNSVIVKIFVVFDVLPEFQEILKMEAFNKDLKFFDFKKYLELKVLCNYEFIRHYIKGTQSEWSVSKMNHIKDKDVLRMYGMTK